jgi:hypothetical protein
MKNQGLFLFLLAAQGALGAAEMTEEVAADYAETQRAIAESRAWDVERLTREAAAPEAMLCASETWPSMVALKRTRALAANLSHAGVDVKGALKKLEAFGAPPASPEEDRARFAEIAAVRRALAFSNPLLNFDRIVFLKHDKMTRGEVHMCDQYLGFNQKKGGGVYVLEKPFGGSPSVRPFLQEPVKRGRLAGRTLGDEGSFVGLNVDYDASRLVFAYTEAEWAVPTNDDDWTDQPGGERKVDGQPKHAKHYYWKPQGAFNIFSVDADGKNLVQLTDGMWNDTHPCFLPNGRIVFVSERLAGQTRCSARALPCTTLHAMMPDGSDLVKMSYHETTEWHPSVDNAGMIVYTRWDYVDRDSDVAHHPWVCYPDGRNPQSFHGNYPRSRESRPWMEMSIRAVPGSPLYIATAAAHHGEAYGSIVLVDPRVSDDHSTAQVRRVTPEYYFPESEDLPGRPMPRGTIKRHADSTAYLDPLGTPWPLSETYFLAVYRRHAKEPYGIYLCDTFGNRELLYRDAAISCLDPMPFAPRPRPPILENQSKLMQADRAPNEPAPRTGEIALMDVYESQEPWPEGMPIRSIRVVAVFPKATFDQNDPRVGIAEQSLTRGVLGTAPVEADGSAYFVAPAGCEIYFQALDENGLAVQTMRSGTYVQPGERLTCVGCHENKKTSSGSRRDGKAPLALARPPSRLQPEGEGSYPLSFPRLVQPILDKHCVDCHTKEAAALKAKSPDAKGGPPDLRGDVFGKWGWSNAYHSLTVNHAKANSMAWSMCGGNGVMQSHNEPQYSIPGKIGARVTKLYPLLAKGHGGVKLTPAEMRRITCWLDCNSVFYGDYYDMPRQAKGEILWPRLGVPEAFRTAR